MAKNQNEKSNFDIALWISIVALILSGVTFWYTFLRPSNIFATLPPNILFHKFQLTSHDATFGLPCIVMTVSFSSFGPENIIVEDVLIKLHHDEKKFLFAIKRELPEFIIPSEPTSTDKASEPISMLMNPIHLSPNTSCIRNYVFTPYNDIWKAYPCIGEVEIALFVKVDGKWIETDKRRYLNSRANWETMKGFSIASYIERSESIERNFKDLKSD